MDDWYKKNEIRIQIRDYQTGLFDAIVFHIKSRFYRQGGTVVRGPKRGVASADGDTGQYTPIRNDGSTTITHEIAKSVTEEHTQSSTLSKGVQLDLTSKVSASYGAVSADLESHLGVTVNQEDAESTSTTTEDSFSDTVPVPPGKEVAIVFTEETLHYTQDFTIDAIADCSFGVTFNRLGNKKDMLTGKNTENLLNHKNKGLWDSIHHDTYTTHFDSIHDFCGFIRGYDVRAPAMAGYVRHGHVSHGWSARAQAAIYDLEKAELLELKLTGTEAIEAQSGAAFSVQNIANLTDDEVKKMYGSPV